jgi:ankyrin repeat protein
MMKDLTRILEEYVPSLIFSEAGLRELFERHGFLPNTDYNPHMGDYHFFAAACSHERVSEGILRCLLEYFPDAASAPRPWWRCATPLHMICSNKNATLGMVKLIIEAAPESVQKEDDLGRMPLHKLCCNINLDDEVAVDILKFLVMKYPEAIQHFAGICEDGEETDSPAILPIHLAAEKQSTEFCSVLIEAYPGSERLVDLDLKMPLHHACNGCNAAKVEYLYKLYPDAINHTTSDEEYPIHVAIYSCYDLAASVVIVQFLLDCDRNVKFQKFQGESLLHWACRLADNTSVALVIIRALYDTYPEAIFSNEIGSAMTSMRYPEQVRKFIDSQLVYSRQAKEIRLMTRPDKYGQLPLHTALRNNVTLGSIKLLVKCNPSAIYFHDKSGALPLHLACQHHDSASVVQYLLGIDKNTIAFVDMDGDTPLHYACHGGKFENIAVILDKYNGASVSKVNSRNKLPIDLLWESEAVVDRESTDYVDAMFRLLKAYPDSLGRINTPDSLNLDRGDEIICCLQKIMFRVKDETGEEIHFKAHRQVEMAKVFRAYASRKEVDGSSLQFSLRGEPIHADDTFESLGLEDNDRIDVTRA